MNTKFKLYLSHLAVALFLHFLVVVIGVVLYWIFALAGMAGDFSAALPAIRYGLVFLGLTLIASVALIKKYVFVQMNILYLTVATLGFWLLLIILFFRPV